MIHNLLELITGCAGRALHPGSHKLSLAGAGLVVRGRNGFVRGIARFDSLVAWRARSAGLAGIGTEIRAVLAAGALLAPGIVYSCCHKRVLVVALAHGVCLGCAAGVCIIVEILVAILNPQNSHLRQAQAPTGSLKNSGRQSYQLSV